MALSAPRSFFGVHSWTPYNRTTGLFYGTLKVLKGSSLSLSSELVELSGGTSKYPWAIEESLITAEMSLKFSQYEDFLFELFLGKAPTSNSAETTGSVTTLTNKNGTSVAAATGIASIDIDSGNEADLKFGKYVVKVVTTSTVDVYYSSDLDIGRGANGTYQNDLLKITASALTVTTAGVETLIPNFGLNIVGGASAIRMVVGDTATFMVRPINTGSMSVDIGGQADSAFPEFGSIVMAAKRGNGEMFEMDCVRCKAAGMPLNFEQNTFSEGEVKIKCLYDQDVDKVFSFRHVKSS